MIEWAALLSEIERRTTNGLQGYILKWMVLWLTGMVGKVLMELGESKVGR
jgi:hypothetical protein